MKRIFLALLTLLATLAPAGAAENANSIPLDADTALRNAKEMTLLSLRPYPEVKEGGFHGFKILGQTALAEKPQAAAEAALREAFKNWDGLFAACFNPRHGIRVKSGDAVFDFVICFECQSVLVLKGEKRAGSFGITGNPGVLDALLKAAGIALPPAAK
jgi:hypothetical protein